MKSISSLLYSVQTHYDVGPFRFIQSIGAVEIERINLPWGYMDSMGNRMASDVYAVFVGSIDDVVTTEN